MLDFGSKSRGIGKAHIGVSGQRCVVSNVTIEWVLGICLNSILHS